MNLSSTSLTSGTGIDVASVVDQLIYVEQAPERLLSAQRAKITLQMNALNAISDKLDQLQSNVQGLKSVVGALNSRSVSSSNEQIVSASAQPGTPAGQHVIVVNKLATRSSFYSDPLATSATTIANGSFDLTIGGKTKNIVIGSSNNSLSKLATYINGLALGVTASVMTDANGARLTMISNDTGTNNNITIANNTTIAFTRSATAVNAELTVDSVPVNSASNTISTVLTGVTLNLTDQDPDASVILNVAKDNETSRNAISAFVDSYNAVVSAINAQFTYDAASKTTGPLADDSMLRQMQSQLLSSVTYNIKNNNGIVSLAALGIDMNNDGTLTLDEDELTNALENKNADVLNFFQGTTGNYAANFDKMLSVLTGITNGAVTVDLQGMTQAQKSIDKQIDQYEVRITAHRQQLLDQYSRVDVMLRQLPLLQSQLTAQLDSLKNNQ